MRAVRLVGPLAVALLSISPAMVRAAEISGRVRMPATGKGMIEVAYSGTDAAGATVFNGAGASAGPTASRVASTTFRPRITEIACDPQGGIAYRHIGLPRGTFLIYARLVDDRGGAKRTVWSDWRLVRVPTIGSRIRIDMALSAAHCGALHVSAPGRRGLLGIRVTPADAMGRELMPNASSTFGLAEEADLGARGADLTGLRAGTYRLELREIHRKGTPQSGQWSTFRDLGAWTVRIEAARRLDYALPRPGR